MLNKIRTISELYKKGSHLEAQQMMMEWWEEALKYREDNIALKEQNKTLRGQLEIKGKMVWEKPYYWLVDENKKDGPFCQVCWDKDEKQIHLVERAIGEWACGVCKIVVWDGNYQKPVRIKSRYGTVA